jgi:MoaA/NifB/PqqE/SkfB family radical SAM enzyme
MNPKDCEKRKQHVIFGDLNKRVLNGEKIKVAIFQVSKKCPYECAYCYRESTSNGDIVSFDTAAIIIKKLEGDGWKVFPIVAEIVDGVEQHLQFMKHHEPYEISTTGHPLLERDEWFDILKSNNVDGLRITVFPTDRLHFNWTKCKRDNVLRAIDLALKNGLHVTWNFLLSRQTRPYLRGQVEAAIKSGVNRFHVNMFFPGGRGSALAHELLSETDLFKVKTEYEELVNEFRNVIQVTRNGLMGPSTRSESISAILSGRNMFCFAGTGDHGQMIFIDTDLSVYGCLTHLGPDLRIGSISKNGDLIFNGNNPLKDFNRSDCFMRHYTRSKCLMNY